LLRGVAVLGSTELRRMLLEDRALSAPEGNLASMILDGGEEMHEVSERKVREVGASAVMAVCLTKQARALSEMKRLLETSSSESNVVAYGIDSIREAMEEGLIRTLLVCETSAESIHTKELEESVVEKGGEIMTIWTKHAHELDMYGGVVALLRYTAPEKDDVIRAEEKEAALSIVQDRHSSSSPVEEGVGASIRSLAGESWGTVIADDAENKSWKLSTGRVAKKATNGVRWDWEQNVDYLG